MNFIFYREQMLSAQTVIGATTQGTTMADIIINNVNGVADGIIQGFSQFLHDPKSLKDTVSIFTKTNVPRKFADAVVFRRIVTQKLDDVWNFPLNMSVPTTSPTPWAMLEATVRSGTQFEPEFNLMRTMDFIGRNYLRFRLPQVDTSNIRDSAVLNGIPVMSDPDHIYLGAWHRDLIPRIINKVEFYPRSNSHKLFSYTGYDIYVHNILFGNAQKEMNDLMSGEDKFEICYDPYYVNGSATGLASYKGIDAFASYTVDDPLPNKGGFIVYPTEEKEELRENFQDGLIDYFQVDTTMDNYEFREFYRKGVWYETPSYKNYNVRHSIHSRRIFHQAKDITIPLDILPFGYSVASSLPSAALSGECGFIKVIVHENWLDRAFYLTKMSDVPTLYPLVNHIHYEAGDTNMFGDVLDADDPRIGWVNERALGRFGDPKWVRSQTSSDEDDADQEFRSKTKYSQPGNVVGASTGNHLREGIIPTRMGFDGVAADKRGLYRNYPGVQGIAATTRNGGTTPHARITTVNNWQNAQSRSTTLDINAIARNDRLSELDYHFIHKMSDVDKAYYNIVRNDLSIKLLQVGYQSLPIIRDLLAKLPNIYITTEWDDQTRGINQTSIDINNDLYIQAIVMWFIPTDSNGVESMRLYPVHMVDHELPVIPGIKLINEQSQGTTIYDWETMNIVNPAQMKLSPLTENMGLISFSPTLTANTLPLAYYDSNISGYLKAHILNGEGSISSGTTVNLKRGNIRIITIGVNGAANVNLNLEFGF